MVNVAKPNGTDLSLDNQCFTASQIATIQNTASAAPELPRWRQPMVLRGAATKTLLFNFPHLSQERPPAEGLRGTGVRRDPLGEARGCMLRRDGRRSSQYPRDVSVAF